MRQPLGATPLGCAAFLPHADDITPAAWVAHDDRLCVPRQLAEVLQVPLGEALAWFDDLLEPGWRSVVVSAEQLK